MPSAVAGRRAVRVRDGLALLRDRAYRRICGIAVLLGLVTASDAFVLVGAQQRAGVGPGWLPLLPDAVTTSGLAVVQTGQALARTVATVVFGVIAAGGGLGVAFWVFGGGLVIGLGVSGRWRP